MKWHPLLIADYMKQLEPGTTEHAETSGKLCK